MAGISYVLKHNWLWICCDVTNHTPRLDQIFDEHQETLHFQQMDAFWCRTVHINHCAQWSSNIKLNIQEENHIFGQRLGFKVQLYTNSVK